MEQQYDQLLEALETCERGSKEFLKIVNELEVLAESGHYDACEILAELMSTEQSVRDPRIAYFWYYIASKHQGFRTAFKNEGSIETYVGPEGDFRNEAMVAELIEVIGIDAVGALDDKAEEWMLKHPAIRS